MEVTQVIARHVRIQLKRRVSHASHSRTHSDNLIVSVQLSDGKIGYGEGVPREYVTGETITGCLELLGGSNLKQQLKFAHNFPQLLANAEAIALPAVANDERGIAGNAARCAVELAYLDAFGRSLGEPMMNVAQRLAPELYRPQEQVQYSGVILSAKGWKARLQALGYRLAGFAQIKVKVGFPGQDDVRRMRTIRRCVGRHMQLRVDANEAWQADELARIAERLQPSRIGSIEQPVKHAAVNTLAGMRTELTTPIMLDESLCSQADAEAALANGTAHAFNLRLSKCGGFIPTLRLAQFAAAHGFAYQLGCQVGETGVLSAAGRQFACSVRGLTAIEGSFDRHLVYDPLTTEDITFSSRGGIAPMLSGSGLGVKIDPARLDAVTLRREVLLG